MITLRHYSCFLVLFIALFYTSFAQRNVVGKPGGILTPSAQWDSLRQVGFSFSYIPESYSINNFMKRNVGPENIYGVSVPLTRFLEVNVNFTRKPAMADRIGVGDRHIDMRIRILKEGAILPSLVVVITPPEGESTYLSQDFFVATKNVYLGKVGQLRVSGGYSLPYFYRLRAGKDGNPRGFTRKESIGNNYLNGFFGSLHWQPWEFLGVIVEHDSQGVNSGLFVQWRDRIVLQGNLFGNRELGLTASVRFPLDFAPFELRKYVNNN